jgi:histidinol dehydrogenase
MSTINPLPFEWKRMKPDEIKDFDRSPVNTETLAAAAQIVDDVRRHGEAALRRHAARFGEIADGEPLLLSRPQLESALARLPSTQRELLERTAERISIFARAQFAALSETTVDIPGGRAGHRIVPVLRAGCYAPGGRYPLPSSVLMTAVTARVAGVQEVWVASPNPGLITIAAAAFAGADGLLVAGGAHAIAAMAFGAGDIPPCDVIVGPGNRWVTAAKQLVSGRVGIDMLAGPSELVVLADSEADPGLVAADLLAQAEHDPDALPILVSTSQMLIDKVEVELEEQLQDLTSRQTAIAALSNGCAVFCSSMDEAIEVCDRFAPEHLEVMTTDCNDVAGRLQHWGGLFIGAGSAEVLGDYGAGPNHTLPTGGIARFAGGLSVYDFLRVRTWMEISDQQQSQPLVDDCIELARLEGLEGHARAAERRSVKYKCASG